ncbi:heavy metal-associated isoprenylated plant protein 39 [Eucalyptus grandis]|uniref:heavy metal-associated isoprenylated plant protein 39 n=1 Tax=Eucalyptus grandis TaxID=71139 RepID=UPI00192EE19B|nr:heavy metal-associated isoprenylated plant protein 39 [Eucalyptus grandis]
MRLVSCLPGIGSLSSDRGRAKAMRLVSAFGGIGSLSMDTKDNKLTVSGEFDPVKVVSKLRKSWRTEIVSVGKEDEGKKDEGKKNEDLANALQTYYSTPITYYCAPRRALELCHMLKFFVLPDRIRTWFVHRGGLNKKG